MGGGAAERFVDGAAELTDVVIAIRKQIAQELVSPLDLEPPHAAGEPSNLATVADRLSQVLQGCEGEHGQQADHDGNGYLNGRGKSAESTAGDEHRPGKDPWHAKEKPHSHRHQL